jgi:hypothetical protein
MISKNLTLEVSVDNQRLLTSVWLLDREAGLSFSIPLQASPEPYQALRTVFDGPTTTVIITNEGLQQLASLIEGIADLVEPPPLRVNENELKEILFARAYFSSFNHPNTGQLERTVIAKLLAYILFLGGDVLGALGTDLAV